MSSSTKLTPNLARTRGPPCSSVGSRPGTVAGAFDDLVLHVRHLVHEVGAVPGHANDQATMALGVCLRLAQHRGVDHVKLQLKAAHGEERAEQLAELPAVGLAVEHLRRERHVEDGPVLKQSMVDPGDAIEAARGSVAVTAARWPNPLGQRLARPPAIGQRPDAEAQSHGESDAPRPGGVFTVPVVAVRLDLLHEPLTDPGGHRIRRILVVAVLGSPIDQPLPQPLVREVGLDLMVQLLGGHRLLVKDQMLDRR